MLCVINRKVLDVERVTKSVEHCLEHWRCLTIALVLSFEIQIHDQSFWVQCLPYRCASQSLYYFWKLIFLMFVRSETGRNWDRPDGSLDHVQYHHIQKYMKHMTSEQSLGILQQNSAFPRLFYSGTSLFVCSFLSSEDCQDTLGPRGYAKLF